MIDREDLGCTEVDVKWSQFSLLSIYLKLSNGGYAISFSQINNNNKWSIVATTRNEYT